MRFVFSLVILALVSTSTFAAEPREKPSNDTYFLPLLATGIGSASLTNRCAQAIGKVFKKTSAKPELGTGHLDLELAKAAAKTVPAQAKPKKLELAKAQHVGDEKFNEQMSAFGEEDKSQPSEEERAKSLESWVQNLQASRDRANKRFDPNHKDKSLDPKLATPEEMAAQSTRDAQALESIGSHPEIGYDPKQSWTERRLHLMDPQIPPTPKNQRLWNLVAKNDPNPAVRDAAEQRLREVRMQFVKEAVAKLRPHEKPYFDGLDPGDATDLEFLRQLADKQGVPEEAMSSQMAAIASELYQTFRSYTVASALKASSRPEALSAEAQMASAELTQALQKVGNHPNVGYSIADSAEVRRESILASVANEENIASWKHIAEFDPNPFVRNAAISKLVQSGPLYSVLKDYGPEYQQLFGYPTDKFGASGWTDPNIKQDILNFKRKLALHEQDDPTVEKIIAQIERKFAPSDRNETMLESLKIAEASLKLDLKPQKNVGFDPKQSPEQRRAAVLDPKYPSTEKNKASWRHIALNDPDPFVQLAAQERIFQASALKEVFKNDDVRLRNMFVMDHDLNAMGKLNMDRLYALASNQNYLPGSDRDPKAREMAIRLLAALDPKRAAPYLPKPEVTQYFRADDAIILKDRIAGLKKKGIKGESTRPELTPKQIAKMEKGYRSGLERIGSRPQIHYDSKLPTEQRLQNIKEAATSPTQSDDWKMVYLHDPSPLIKQVAALKYLETLPMSATFKNKPEYVRQNFAQLLIKEQPHSSANAKLMRLLEEIAAGKPVLKDGANDLTVQTTARELLLSFKKFEPPL